MQLVHEPSVTSVEISIAAAQDEAGAGRAEPGAHGVHNAVLRRITRADLEGDPLLPRIDVRGRDDAVPFVIPIHHESRDELVPVGGG